MNKILFTLLIPFLFTACDRNTSLKSGYFVEFQNKAKKNTNEYMDLIVGDIQHAKEHPQSDLNFTLSDQAATAVVVGSGTTGMEALVYAANFLPKGSTLMLLQNSTDDRERLLKTLKENLPNGEDFQYVISPPLDIGQLEAIDSFMNKYANELRNTRIFIFTADRAIRFIPDALPVKDVIAQVVRRSSATIMSNKLDDLKTTREPIIKILISSECAQNRSDYRIPNLGPYQIGKIVGDELFYSANLGGDSISLIAYSGAMMTGGQYEARKEEYNYLSKAGKTKLLFNEFLNKKNQESSDIDPMDSIGAMFNVFFHAINDGELQVGKVYSIYGPSVNPSLGYSIGKLAIIEPASYLWNPLEK